MKAELIACDTFRIWNAEELYFLDVAGGKIIDASSSVCFLVGWKYEDVLNWAKSEFFEVSEPRGILKAKNCGF